MIFLVGTIQPKKKKHNNIQGKEKLLEDNPQVWSEATKACNGINTD